MWVVYLGGDYGFGWRSREVGIEERGEVCRGEGISGY